jgi:hypothetical protein
VAETTFSGKALPVKDRTMNRRLEKTFERVTKNPMNWKYSLTTANIADKHSCITRHIASHITCSKHNLLQPLLITLFTLGRGY